MYLRRRGWTESDTFSIETEAGEIRPTITGEHTCTVDMGRAKLVGDGTLTSDDREFAYQHIVGNPQTAVEVEDLDFDLPRYGAPIESNTELPEPDERVLLAPRRRPRDHRAHLRARRGGDDVVRDGRERRAVAAVLKGADSLVTVHLDGGDLEVEVERTCMST